MSGGSMPVWDTNHAYEQVCHGVAVKKHVIPFSEPCEELYS